MGKKHTEDYGSYILNNKEQLLKRKRKIIILKRTGLLLIVLLTVLITLGLTLPEFNLAEVTITGNEFVSNETILTSAAIQPEINIFKINTSKIEEILMKNSYIEEVKINRKLPNKVSIKVKECKIAFSVQGAEGVYAIDENGKVLGVRETIEAPQVLALEGVPQENLIEGQLIQGEDGGDLKGAKVIHDFLGEKGYFEEYQGMRLEITNFVDYKLYVDNLYIKLGASENMNEKLAKAFSILNNPQFAGMKGYIDVSFKGNPVIYKES